ncbi:MAG TPA: hypothetical protein VIK99_04920 [Thermaerobacter sp.]
MKGKGQGHVVIRALGRNESPPMLLLIGHAIETARQQGYKTIEIGTGNSSIGQLALYQKFGFRITGIDRDFFVRRYRKPIWENGIQCRDMIRLSQDLT